LTAGIPVDKWDDFVFKVLQTQTSLGLSNEFCKTLSAMAYVERMDKLVWEVRYDDGFKSSYGYLMMVRNSEKKTISCAYAVHSLSFKLADRRVETRSTQTFFWIPIGEEISVHHEPVKFGTKDMDAIKETYMRYKALQALQSEGIITQITFE
jgi:hypothetical protein